MDKHEAALKTYEILQKRKKQKEVQQMLDSCVGWNGYAKYMAKRNKYYYSKRHTV